jgi:hypothetical protein
MNRILLIICFISCTTAFAQDTVALEGKWLVDVQATFLLENGNVKEQYGQMPDDKKALIRKTFEGRQFNFYTDSLIEIVIMVNAVKKVIKGTWYCCQNSDTLTISIDARVSRYKIVKLSPNRIKLVYNNPIEQGLLRSLILQRNK